MNIYGANSQWSTDELIVGWDGTAYLSITNEAEVQVQGDAWIARGVEGGGLVQVADAQWAIESTLTFGDAGEGTLYLRPAGQVEADTVIVGENGSLWVFVNPALTEPTGLLHAHSNLALNGEIEVFTTASPQPGSYLIATYDGNLDDSGLSIGRTPEGLIASIDTSTNGHVWLHLQEPPDAIFSDRFESESL